MSITSRINEMSSHIEQAYDELQGLGADLTNVNKNIENISMVLDDIYDSMPQVSGEGTNLTLEDTRVGKIKSTLKGNTSQSGTPTPTSPIPINVVSGDNEINVVGKNLLPTSDIISTSGTISNGVTFTRNSDGSITANGTATSAISIYINSDYTKLPAGTYTFSDSVPSGESGTTFFLYADVRHTDDTGWDTYNFSSANTTTGMTQTIPEAFKFKTRIVIRNGQTLNNVVFKPMLEVGSSATSYEPYQGNTYNIDLPVENLLQNSLTSGTINGITYVVNEDKSVTLSGTATSITWLILNNNLPLEAGTYTMSQGYTGNDVRMYSTGLGTYTVDGVKTITKTTSVSGDVSINIPNGTVITTPITIKPMIQKGSKANSYTPYGTTPIELCKIGNYQDYFVKSDGRNLFDKDSISNGFLDESGIVGGDTSAYRTSDFIPILPNTAYYKTTTSSPRTKYYDKNKQPLNTTTYWDIPIGGNAGTFTTPSTAYYFRFSYPVTGVNVNSIMINKGTTALPYEPFGVGKWYLHKEIGKYTFTGNETGVLQNSGKRFDITCLDNNMPICINNSTPSEVSQIYCNILLASSGASTWGGNQGISYNTGTNGQILVSISGSTTTQAYLSALKDNYCYYILATPTNTEVTYEPLIDQLNLLEKAMSKDGQTNISQVNNDLPFIISASALKEWQENTSLNSTLSMVNPLSLGNTLNTQDNNTQPIEVDNIEPLEEEENE